MAQKELRKDNNFKELVSKFGLIEDDYGIQRCKGRLECSDLPLDTKELIILPKEHRFSWLQIQQCHEKVMHSEVGSKLAEVRSRFWVPKVDE